jgi:hypothetical protein
MKSRQRPELLRQRTASVPPHPDSTKIEGRNPSRVGREMEQGACREKETAGGVARASSHNRQRMGFASITIATPRKKCCNGRCKLT